MTGRTTAQSAVEWLTRYMNRVGGRAPVRDALNAASATGFSEPAIRRAARTLGLRVELLDGEEWWEADSTVDYPDRTDSDATVRLDPTPAASEKAPGHPVRVPAGDGRTVVVGDLEALTMWDERLWNRTR